MAVPPAFHPGQQVPLQMAGRRPAMTVEVSRASTIWELVHAAGGPDSVRLDRKGPLPVTWNKPVGVRTSGEVY
jgi:hypothetical protein